jgi:hypothetical protein
MMRAVVDAEIELAQLMHEPPAMESKAVTGWIARLQSLYAEVRRYEKRALRADPTKLAKRKKK